MECWLGVSGGGWGIVTYFMHCLRRGGGVDMLKSFCYRSRQVDDLIDFSGSLMIWWTFFFQSVHVWHAQLVHAPQHARGPHSGWYVDFFPPDCHFFSSQCVCLSVCLSNLMWCPQSVAVASVMEVISCSPPYPLVESSCIIISNVHWMFAVFSVMDVDYSPTSQEFVCNIN